ncbi:MAG TPA: DUF4349 domain-containing protein [Candidatus Dormibacteraeota bacterium]|nr:DUF4349 domain-containing protein [Candidatus Dormibacteraeota bacterium]
MKKLIVTVAILAAAAACGGAASTTGAGSSLALRSANGTAQSSTGQPVKSNPAPAQPAQGGGTTNPAGTDTVPVLQGPPVIRQAQLAITVNSGSFDSKLASVRSLVESEQGYIAGTDAQSSPVDSQIRTGVINFMVPAANFDTTIDLLTKVGKVQSEHIAGTDVSAQYVDLNARLANAQAQRDAMLALLARATSISDIINIQTQVGQITGQIEQLEGQIKYLDQNTAFSSIAVTLTESGAPVQEAQSDSWGFATALSQAAHNFVTTIDYVVSGLGAVGPFLVLLGLGYLLWRRRRPAPAIKHA